MGCWDAFTAGPGVLLRVDPALPYDRDLPGEIMFWDIDAIAESLSWELDMARLRFRLRPLGPDNGRPSRLAGRVCTQRLFLVTGGLAAFAVTARRHGLTEPISSWL
jgi:hypothetical protein